MFENKNKWKVAFVVEPAIDKIKLVLTIKVAFVVGLSAINCLS